MLRHAGAAASQLAAHPSLAGFWENDVSNCAPPSTLGESDESVDISFTPLIPATVSRQAFKPLVCVAFAFGPAP